MRRDFDTITRKVSRFVDKEFKIVAYNLKKPAVQRRLVGLSALLMIFAIVLSIFVNFSAPQNTQAGNVSPAGYRFKTGKFVGSGGGRMISGIGFAPEMVILKASTNIGAYMKTSAMLDNTTAVLSANTADDTNGILNLESDGFSVNGTSANAVNVNYTWMAWAGSDCSASGIFCIGNYYGAGSGTKAITTGFTPNLVIVKSATGIIPAWRSSSMSTNYAQFLTALGQDTTGAYFTSLDATGFTVGATINTAAIHHYVAFKSTASKIAVGGPYVGNGTSQSISVGWQPDAVIVKDANTTTAVGAVYNVDQSYGDSSSYFTATANVVGGITGLTATGFNVGNSTTTNSSTFNHFWIAFAGAENPKCSGTFKMATGTYTGTGANTNININGLGFTPDLVIIKGNTAQTGVFRTALHSGDTTSYLDVGTADFTNGILALNPDGFLIGGSTVVNTAATYYWTAYGNAWRPGSNSGACDFTIGAYYGNGVARSITNIPFQPDFVAIKGNVASTGTFRTSDMATNYSGYFSGTAEATGMITSFNANGFSIGTAANVNTATSLYRYFGFKKNSTTFNVGTYSGTGAAGNNVTTAGFQPDNIWIKSTTTAQLAVQRSSDMATDSAIPFTNVASGTTYVTGIRADGFTVGANATYTNASGTNNYRYVVWKKTNTYAAPTYNFKTGKYVGSGGARFVTGLGFNPELVIIKASTAAGAQGALMKSTAMLDNATSILAAATADETTGVIGFETDGFSTFGTQANAVNVNYIWMAFGGSDCSATGTMCIGNYYGAGSGTKAITTSFAPNLVIVKSSTTVIPAWRSTTMATNYAEFFTAANYDTAGAYFTTIDAAGFTVGATINTAAIHHYVAFKSVASKIAVAATTYTGNGTSQSISVGWRPEAVVVKNGTQTTATGSVWNVSQSYGNSTSYFINTANVVGAITALTATGFDVGNSTTVNGASPATYYWFAFGGSAAPSSSGTFKMASGSYTGTGANTNLTITGLGFQADLIIIKGNTAQTGVFRTSVHNGDATSYLDVNTADFASGITAINPDGFTIGGSAIVNTVATYYWTAYGGAWRPGNNSGAADFTVGAYYGNGVARSITNLPWQPNFVAIKGNVASTGVFSTSAMTAGNTGYYSATAEATGIISSLNTDGFSIGTGANVNTAATLYRYFAFKTGSNFAVGSYTGNGTSSTVAPGFQPGNIWIKNAAVTNAAVQRSSDMATDSAIPFTNLASATGVVTGLTATGFTTGANAYSNTNGSTYRYVAWRRQMSVFGTSNLTTGTVAVAVNSTLQTGYTGTINSGFWSVKFLPPMAAGDVITVWVTGAPTSAAVTKYNGASDEGGLVLNSHNVSIGSASNQSLTLTNLGSYNYTNDTNIPFNVATSTLTLDPGAAFTDETLNILAGNTLTVAGTETATTVNLTNAGTLTSGGNSIYNIAGSWTNTGTFTCSTSTTNLTATTGTMTINSTGATTDHFYNLNVGVGSGTATWNMASVLDVDGTLNINYGTLSMNGNNLLDLAGNLSIGANGLYTKGSGNFAINATANTVTLSDATTAKQDLGTLVIGNSSVAKIANMSTAIRATTVNVTTGATLSANGSNTLYIVGTGTPFTIAGTFTPSTGTVVYEGDTVATNITAATYNNLNIGGAATTNTYTAAGTLNVGGVLTIVSSSGTNTFNASTQTVNLTGNGTPFVVSATEVFTPSTSTINYAPAGTTGVTVAGTTYNHVIFNKAANTFTLGGNLSTGVADGNFTITAGIFDVTTNNYSIGVGGLWTNNGTFNPRAGTVTFQDGATDETISGNLTTANNGGYFGFYNLVFNNTNSVLTTFNAAANIGNNLTVNTGVPVNGGTGAITVANDFINNGTFTSTTGTLSVARNFTNQGTFTANGGTVSLNGVGGTTQIVSSNQAATTFNNLSATATTARTINFESNTSTGTPTFVVTGTWTATGAAGQLLTLGRNGGTGTDQWKINPTAWTVNYVYPYNSNNMATNPINPVNYTDGLNNTNWFPGSNNPPSTPTSLTQGKTTGATDIAESAWTTGNQPWFGFSVTDPDAADTVKYRIQVDNTSSSFANLVLDYTHSTLSARGTTFAYHVGQTGGTYAVGAAAMTLSDSSTGYWWRVYSIDNSAVQSVSPAYFGTQATVDLKVDATAPTGATIYDGNDGSQHPYNDYNSGSLTALSAYWTATVPTFTVSGAPATNIYQYGIGTTSGGTEILTWTYTGGTGTQTYANATGLVLQTGVKYYFTVRAYDVAGNMGVFYSPGQMVYPTLSFSYTPSTIPFDNLNNANTWTSTNKTITFTTSTNAVGGYVIQARILQLLTALINPTQTIANWSGTYATPTAWAGNCTANSQCGFGYTSNDTLVQGSNRFASGVNYAPYSLTAPGDVVADHTAAVNGTTGAVTNEQFIISNRLSVSQFQTADTYQSTIQAIITANF
jgi:hypothetical protein